MTRVAELVFLSGTMDCGMTTHVFQAEGYPPTQRSPVRIRS